MSDAFYESDAWQGLRYRTLRRFGFNCMACSASRVELHVDHIKPRSKYPELALDPENLQVLCRPCNLGKAADFEDDFRPRRNPEYVDTRKLMENAMIARHESVVWTDRRMRAYERLSRFIETRDYGEDEKTRGLIFMANLKLRVRHSNQYTKYLESKAREATS